ASSTNAAGGGLFAGNTANPLATTVIFQNDCAVSGNISQYGGGMCVVETNLIVENAVISDNTAIYGGGAYWFSGTADIHDCMIEDNIATGDDTCSGAGFYVLDSSANIQDVVLTGNAADGWGGAIFFAGPPLIGGTQDVINCLMTENSAVYDGGAISSNFYASPLVANCTIANNAVTDSFGSGGGVGCYDSFVEIIDSILWGNTAVYGPQIGIGDPLESDNPISTVMMTYTDIQGGEDGVFVGDDWGPWLIPSETNIDKDPQFAAISAADPWKNYYLSQIDAGQLTESPCVDAGSTTAAAVGMDTETTRTDHVVDSDDVDMGYHYDASEEVAEYSLMAGVFIADMFRYGELEVLTPSLIDPIPVPDDPNTTTFVYQFKQGTVVELLATPEPKIPDDPNSFYRVARWIGADSEPFYYGQDNTITMTGFEAVQVEFELGVAKDLHVPGVYDTIEDAIVAARSGDRIILERREGDPYLVSNPDGINFGGKQLVLTSTDPNDPDVVANTVIDLQGTRYNSKRALHFESGEDANSIVEGITFRNAFTARIGASYALSTGRWPWWNGADPEPWDPIAPSPDPLPPFRAASGMDAIGDSYGGAILCENGSSPTIRKCVFEDCTVAGGIGGDGRNGGDVFPGFPPGLPDITDDIDSVSGGHSGMGQGDGYGGAIAVRSGSSPIISQCVFTNNRATGGWGGIPGDAGGAYNAGRYGWGGNDLWGLIYAMNQNPGINDWLNAGNGYGSGRGGAIYVDAGCDPLISQCTFKGNYARPGYVSEGGA
ncbi:MAG: hypothetical protein ACYSOW_05695, partial [Planctomycetota bacterium]